MKEKPVVKHFDLLEGLKHGQVKCPKCGATDISRADESSQLQCNFCRTMFDFTSTEYGVKDDREEIDRLSGINVSTGARDMGSSDTDIVSIKCQSCAAEVVINSAETLEARCHWCRNFLSLNNVVPNGAVPDLVVPFQWNKANAQSSIERYIADYKYFAHSSFKKQFNAENIFAVYLPYMMVDIKAHSVLEGKGESTLSKSHETTGSGSTAKTKTTYEVGSYQLRREFDIAVDDLPIESKRDRLANKGTSNVINAILPFNCKRAVKWNPTLLKGVHSERRDLNVSSLEKSVFAQLYDIGFLKASEMIEPYNRGVRWSSHKQEVIGEKWVSVYLPIWIYTYKRWSWGKVYYTAMNAQTGKIVGTVPLNYLKLIFICSLFVILPMLIFHYTGIVHFCVLMILCPWIFISTYRDYHKSGVKYDHAKETFVQVSELKKEDTLIKKSSTNTAYSMNGANVYPPKK